MLSEELRESLGTAAADYQLALAASPQVLSYLSGRGISQAVIERFQLGVVDGSFADHLIYKGRISIPYRTKLGGVAGMKFRVAHDCGDWCTHQKYITPYPTRIYNPLAFEASDQMGGLIGISEGEFDAMIATFECGIPTVAIPGTDTWVKHPEWRALFDGRHVLVLKDQDEAGEKLANRITHDLEGATVVDLPAKDVNETFLRHGPDAIRKASGL
jgi:DNA primase